MAWYDDLASSMGISSNSLGINDQKAKDARVAAANAQAEAEYQAQKEQARQRYEAMAAENAADRAAATPRSLADLQRIQDTNVTPSVIPQEESMWDKIRHGATSAREAVTSPDPKSAYSKALGAIASPAGVDTALTLAGGLGSMYLNKQGTNAANSAYDAARSKIEQAQQVSGDDIQAIHDDAGQLADRQTAMEGFRQRAAMGLTPEDQAELQKIQRQSAQQFKANNATIGQDMQRRGMANSGLGMAQSMGAADQAMQNQALAGQNQAAQSFAAKQGALGNLANASNTALQGDYARQMGKAQNLGAVNQFNAQQRSNANTAAASNIVSQGGMNQDSKGTQGKGVLDIAKGVMNIQKPKQA